MRVEHNCDISEGKIWLPTFSEVSQVKKWIRCPECGEFWHVSNFKSGVSSATRWSLPSFKRWRWSRKVKKKIEEENT